MAIDESATSQDGFVGFVVNNTPTPIPRQFCLPIERAAKIAIEFVSIGGTSSGVNWVEI
jgi:hypothetical protein